MSNEQGHDNLVNDVEALNEDVSRHFFHDFRSEFATPKIMLVQRLQKLIDNVKDGRYDD